MRLEEAVEYFGGIKALSDILGVWPATIYQWRERGGEIPRGRQYELQVKTGGALLVDTGAQPDEQVSR